MKKPIPFGKYLLLERINVGGMAEVFKAKAFGVEGFERLVAVKRILPSIAEDQEFITMFVDEAKIAVQLTHANIAQIFDLGRVGDSYFIAMEYIHGKDLRAIFDRARKRGETVPVPMACYVAMKVCEGLDYAHNKKDAAGRDLHLVHRDVSPQNVLISYDGEVKLIDFGIAKAAGKAGRTQAGILKGKFGYMSPEQVRGLPLDRRSDIFAVGIVLYELLTGERLFVGESDFSTLEKVRNVEIMPPSTYNRRIPDELEQIVLKALAKDVEDRYQTAMDLHDDLQSFMYTSGNFFSRKDLSAYQRKAFAEEIAKESAREEEYRRMEADLARSGGGSASGLDQFDDIEPLEPSASVPEPRPTAAPPKIAMQAASGGVQQPSRGARKPTLMGVGAAVPPPPPRASGAGGAPPPPPPRPSIPSAPAQPGIVAGPAAAVATLPAASGPSPLAPVAPAGAASPGLDMDWDEEELSTQIYDKPDLSVPSVPDLPDVRGPSAALGSSPGSLGPLVGAPSAGASALVSPPVIGPPVSAPVVGAAGGLGTPGPTVSSALRPSLGAGTAAPPVAPPVMAAPPIMSASAGAPSPFDPTPPSAAREPTASVARTRRDSSRASSRVLLGLGAVLAVGLVAAGGWTLFRSTPGTIQVTTTPPDAVVFLDNHPASSSTSSPFLISNVEPGPHLVEVRRSGYEPWATRVEVGSGQALTLPPVVLTPQAGSAGAAAGVAMGTTGAGEVGSGFTLDSIPSGASVYVGDRLLPQRTPVRVTDLAPGTYGIRVEHGESYAPWVTQITVLPGQILQMETARLTPRSVSVEFVSTPPGAEVVLSRGSERRAIGQTPVTASVEATGGPWTVSMSKPGYQPSESVLVLAEGVARASHSATLVEQRAVGSERPAGARRGGGGASRPAASPGEDSAPSSAMASAIRPSTPSSGASSSSSAAAASGGTGTLQVNSQPWSQVIIDGRVIGNTPQMGITLPAGTHRVELVNPQFNARETFTVNIQPGQVERRVVRLTLPSP